MSLQLIFVTFLYGLANHAKKSAQNEIKFACLFCMLYYMIHHAMQIQAINLGQLILCSVYSSCITIIMYEICIEICCVADPNPHVLGLLDPDPDPDP